MYAISKVKSMWPIEHCKGEKLFTDGLLFICRLGALAVLWPGVAQTVGPGARLLVVGTQFSLR